MPSSSAPFLWRNRHKLGAVAFYVALVFVALGLFTIVRSASVGDVGSVGVGVALVVGGALVMVGRKRRTRR